jgi:hypothetical protein
MAPTSTHRYVRDEAILILDRLDIQHHRPIGLSEQPVAKGAADEIRDTRKRGHRNDGY